MPNPEQLQIARVPAAEPPPFLVTVQRSRGIKQTAGKALLRR